MRLYSSVLALIAAASIAATAAAQTGNAAPPISKADLEALHTLHRDLRSAISSMRAGKPIYQGTRDRAIDAAHQAIVIVEAEIKAASPPVDTKPAVKEPTPPVKVQPKEKKAPVKEATPPKPTVKETAAPKPVETQEEKIAASQATMRKGYEALQTVLKDIKAASSLDAAKSANLESLIQTASTEAMKGINLHAKEG